MTIRRLFPVPLFFVLLLSMLALSGCALRGEGSLLKTLPQPAHVEPLVPERWALPNGLQVLFIKDEEVPLVRGTLYLPGGSLWEREPGVTEAMGSAMRLGGAGRLSADEIDRQLEILAASIGSGFGDEFGTVSFNCLSNDIEKVFGLFSDVVLRPRFEQQRLDLWKGQVLEGIRRRREEPGTVASLAFSELVFPGTPYGRVLVSKDIVGIDRPALVRAHSYLARPDQAIFAVTGKIERQDLERLTRRAFTDWPRRGAPIPPPPAIPREPQPGIYFVELPFTQATIIMGQQGVPRLTPDYTAIDVFNRLFGSSGFGSRLVTRVRSDLGLAYSIYGAISPGVVKGENMIFLQTKTASAGTALLESLKVLHNLQEQAPGADELQERKLAAENSFVFKLASTDSQVQRRAVQEIWHFPEDYDATYIPKMKAVVPNDVRQVASRRWDISKFVIVVVGNSEARDSLLNLLNERPALLRGFTVRKAGFDEKLLP